jgi:hypothetical protein
MAERIRKTDERGQLDKGSPVEAEYIQESLLPSIESGKK